MNRFVTLAGVALLGVAATSTLVLAEDEGARPERRGREMSPEARHGRMKEADTNGDHKVSLEEFTAAHMKRITEMFKKLDRNGDGFISREDRPEGGEHGKGERPERGERGERSHERSGRGHGEGHKDAGADNETED